MAAIFGVWVRYAVLVAARVMGLGYRVFLSTWYRALLTTGALWALVSVKAREIVFPAEDTDVGIVLGLAGGLLLVALVRWIVHARRRMIIGTFTDYSGEKPVAMPGISTLLQVELARLYELIRVVDNSRAVEDAMRGPQNVSFDEERTLFAAEQDENQINNEPLDLPAPIRAEDLTNVLDAVVSIEATMSVGPVKVPIGSVASVVGRLAQGPRLEGSIHCTHDALVVSARTVGDQQSRTWRVDKPLARDAQGLPTVRPEDLVDELAVRVLTDLALQESVKWRATWAYVNGLRAYRECLRTKKDRRLNLERAKAFFLETIAEDDSFDLAHYNLGVVATELGQYDAAEAAFLAAIERNTGRWDPYYGLAQLYFVQDRYDEMLPLCGRMIRLRPFSAESYHLRALANRRTGNYPGAIHDRRRAVRCAWARLCAGALRGKESKVASVAATSLRNLGGIRAYLAKGEVDGAKGDGAARSVRPRDTRQDATAGMPTTDATDRFEDPPAGNGRGRPLRLTIAYTASQWELRQGTFLQPSDAGLHFELGKIYAARQRWRPAVRHFERAVEIMPDRPRYWVQLARAYVERLLEEEGSRAGPEECLEPGAAPAGALARRRAADRQRRRDQLWRQALSASMRAYEHPSEMRDNGFRRLAELYPSLCPPVVVRTGDPAADRAREREQTRQLERLDRLRRVLDLGDFETRRHQWNGDDPRDEVLEAQLEGFGDEALWEDVQVSLELARRYLNRPEDHRRRRAAVAVSIAERLADRMERLREFHRGEIARQDVYAVIAKVFHVAGEPERALTNAELAVRYNPLSYEARTALADVHLALGHLAEAEKAWQGALVAEPERPYATFRMGETLVRTALGCHAPDRRRDLLTDATGHFRRALDLLDLQGEGDDGLAKGQVAFWLGRALFELDRYDEATTELQVAVLWDYQKSLARLRLGVAYVRMGHFCEGEREFEQILDDDERPRADGDRRTVGPPGDELSWREVVAWARLYHAASRIERDAGVKEAIATIEQVMAEVEALSDGAAAFCAACADWEGWGWFSLGDSDKAIERVSASVEREPTAEAYLHLAQIYADRALHGRKGPERRQDEERARHAAGLARRIGLGRAQQEPLNAVMARLDGKQAAEPVG